MNALMRRLRPAMEQRQKRYAAIFAATSDSTCGQWGAIILQQKATFSRAFPLTSSRLQLQRRRHLHASSDGARRKMANSTVENWAATEAAGSGHHGEDRAMVIVMNR